MKESNDNLQKVSDDLNSLFGEPKPQEPKSTPPKKETAILDSLGTFEDKKETTYTFRLTEEEKRALNSNTKLREPYQAKSGFNKAISFIKEHVRPDIGLDPFEEGEGIKMGEDDLSDIGKKLKENLRVGLKFTMKW